MLAFETVAVARTPDGSELSLVRRGDEWVVRVDGRTLMSSRQHDSEESLAEQALSRHAAAERILIGGLGLGFTLRAVLDRVAPRARVVVAELVPELVSWNRAELASLHGGALEDSRCEVTTVDVLEAMQRARSSFDVILLDVDNGPVALTQAENQRLYAPAGVAACHAALRSGGVLAVWSAGPSDAYAQRLRRAGFEVEVLSVAARKGKGARHVLFLGKRAS